MISTYVLDPDGTVPSFVTNGGYFADARVGDSPQDWTLVGVVTADAPGEPFVDAAALEDYLVSIGGESWLDDEGEPVDLVAQAAWMWAQDVIVP